MAEDYTARATCECYYKFENAGDLGEDEQNQIDMTNTGVTQSATIPNGTFASPSATKSGDFEKGEQDKLYASHADSSEIDDIANGTVLFWFYGETMNAGDYMFIKAAGAAVDWIVQQINAGQGFAARWETVQNAKPTGYSAGNWYFIAHTYDGTNLKLYIGTEEGQVAQVDIDALATTGLDTTGDFYLGCNFNASSGFLDGLLCEVAVFSEALSLSDLEDIQEYGIEGTAVGYTLVIGAGSYALSGQTTNLLKGSHVDIAAGSYALTGQVMTPLKGSHVDIAAGSYALGGQAVTLLKDHIIGIVSGSYALSGQAVGLFYGWRISIGAGSYALSGQVAGLLKGSHIDIVSGSYALSGQVVSLLKGSHVDIVAGSYALSGQAVDLLKGSHIDIVAGSYVLTGQAVSFSRDYVIEIVPGTYILSGMAVDLDYGELIVVYPILFDVLPRERIFELTGRTRIHDISPRARIFDRRSN